MRRRFVAGAFFLNAPPLIATYVAFRESFIQPEKISTVVLCYLLSFVKCKSIM